MQCLLVVEICMKDLVGKAKFPAVAKELNEWFKDYMQAGQTGVLVSHNTPVDVQFLVCEYLRAKMKLPSQIKLCLDTLATIKRFSSLAYRKATAQVWPWNSDAKYRTKTGKPSMGVKPCAMYALQKRQPSENFADTCGDHHDALADARAVAVVLFDFLQFGKKSLYDCVFNTTKKCFQPLTEVTGAMQVKLSEPVVKIEDVPSGWEAAPVRKPYLCHLALTFNFPLTIIVGGHRGSPFTQQHKTTTWCAWGQATDFFSSKASTWGRDAFSKIAGDHWCWYGQERMQVRCRDLDVATIFVFLHLTGAGHDSKVYQRKSRRDCTQGEV